VFSRANGNLSTAATQPHPMPFWHWPITAWTGSS